jgi:putative DNA primase/helicase
VTKALHCSLAALGVWTERNQDSADRNGAVCVYETLGGFMNNVVYQNDILLQKYNERKRDIQRDNIPVELKELTTWYVWGYELRDGQWTKPPLDANKDCEYYGRVSGKSWQKTAAGFQQAVEYCEQHKGEIRHVWQWDKKEKRYTHTIPVVIAGIGVKIIDDFVGVDFDECYSDDVLQHDAEQWVNRLNSYTERSPSGVGVRVFVKGELPGEKGGHRNNEKRVEVYDRRSPRYLTVTGDRLQLGEPTIEHRASQISSLCEQLFGKTSSAKSGVDGKRKRINEKERAWSLAVSFDELSEHDQATFRDLMAQCLEAAETGGDRSSADQKLLNFAVAKSLGKEAVWDRVQGISKFEERGWSYFDNSWTNAEAYVASKKAEFASFDEQVLQQCLKTAEKGNGSAQAGPPVVSTATPKATARLFYERFMDNDHKTLWFHCPDIWRRWDGRVFKEIDEQQLRCQVSDFLESCVTWDSKTEKYVPFATNPQRETAVIQEIKNICTLAADTQAPCWLEGGGPDAANVVSFQNGHLDVERYLEGQHSLLPHSPRWYAYHCLPHKYDRSAKCDQWLNFLDEIFEGDSRLPGFGGWLR